MTPVRPLLSAVLSSCLAVQPLFAAGSPRPQASRFPSEHEAALEKAAESFVAAGQLDADALVNPLVPLATDPEDKSDLARFRALLKEAAALREPVAAKPGAAPDGPAPEILDAKYKSRVLALALKLKADGAKAAETRRELLRKNPPVGPDGKPAGAVPGAGPAPVTEQDKAAIARMEARGGIKDPRMKASADRTAAALGRLMEGGDLPAGTATTPAQGGAPDPAAAELIGVANAAFKGGPNTLATQAPKDPHAAAHPPAEKGWWGKFRDATTIDSLQHKFEDYNKRAMAEAAKTEDQAAANFAQGNWRDGAIDASWAWMQRVAAGDAKAVGQAAIGAAVVVATIVAAPVLLPGAAATAAIAANATALAAGGAATATAGTIIAGKLVTAGLGALLAYNVTTGVGHFAHKPDLVNGALLAANAIAVPGLGKASEFIVAKTAHAVTTRGGRAAAETAGAAALGSTVARVSATAAEGVAAAGTATSGAAVVSPLVEVAAANTATTVQVAVRAGPAIEHVAVRAIEGAAHNTLHVGAHSATAVDSAH